MGTGQLEGTVGHPGVEEAADVAECNEEGQLAQGRHRRLGVPFDMEPAAEGIDGDGARKRHPGQGLGFTRRVRDQCVRGRLLLALFHGLDASEAGGNCPFWV